MPISPRSPRLLKGGLVQVDVATSRAINVVPLQYNPDTLTRTLEVQGAETAGDQSEALRLTGPPTETITLEAELDATDTLEQARVGNRLQELSLHSSLAALETIIYPPSEQVREHQQLAQAGMMEITPAEAPLTVFVWSAQRVVPVRITDFSITEEAFDPQLNPIRAKISLGMRVLNSNDLGFDHRGTSLFTSYHRTKEQLAAANIGGALETLGIKSI